MAFVAFLAALGAPFLGLLVVLFLSLIAPRPVAPAPRAKLARAALEKRARTRLSAAVVLFASHPGRLFKTRKLARLYKTKKT